MRSKHKIPDTHYLTNDFANVIKFMKVTSNLTGTGRTKKTEKTHKNSFPKESVENANLYKSIMSKIMTTHE